MLGLVIERTRALIRSYRWRWLDPSRNAEDIDILELVGPLRYDVFALQDFLTFYLRRQDLAANNFYRFLGEARRQRFYDWKFVSHSIREPHTTRDPVVFAAAFADEVRQAIDVWESMSKGFDRRFPIEVRITDRLLPAASGKRVTARYFLGDGSHRLACLMLQGYTTLPRDHYRIRWYRRLRPNDSTWLLTRKRLIPAPEYFAFLSTMYRAPQRYEDRANFLGFVHDAMPDRMDEVQSIIRADGFDEV